MQGINFAKLKAAPPQHAQRERRETTGRREGEREWKQ